MDLCDGVCSFVFMAVTKVLAEIIQMAELFVFVHGLEQFGSLSLDLVIIFGSWFWACGEAECVAGACGSHHDRPEAKEKEDPGAGRPLKAYSLVTFFFQLVPTI